MVQKFFKEETKTRALSVEEKMSTLAKIENTPVREAERTLLALSSRPTEIKPDQQRAVTEELIEYRFTAPKDLQEKIEAVKGLLAHTHPNINMAELIGKLCELGVKSLAPKSTRAGPVSSAGNPIDAHVHATSQNRPAKRSAIKVHIKEKIWQRDQGKCSNCGSKYAVEHEHIVPVARGGNNDEKNLKLLCKSCNQRAAIKIFGQVKMDSYLNG
jgi:hypothetical protein